MTKVNIKSTKKCAFCKYWYDPTNSAITPRAPNINIWEYDYNAKNKCLKYNINKPAFGFCKFYECKVPVM